MRYKMSVNQESTIRRKEASSIRLSSVKGGTSTDSNDTSSSGDGSTARSLNHLKTSSFTPQPAMSLKKFVKVC